MAAHMTERSSRRVLVIDDSDLARSAMAKLLRDARFEVFEQGTPIGATRLVLREGISVVVIDVNMPAMRGDKLAALFRENPRFERIGLVLISSEPEHELRRLGKEAGADAVVQKSAMTAELVPVVQRLSARAVVPSM